MQPTPEQTFVTEAQELLRAMEESLLLLERNPRDPEALHAVFRAAHTLKGSAGVFGYDAIVEVAHAMESVLDEIRAGAMTVGEDIVALLLACGDHIGAVVTVLRAGGALPQPGGEASRALVQRLSRYLEPVDVAPNLSVMESVGETVETLAGPRVSSDSWHVSARFAADLFRDGLDPVSALNYLDSMAKSVSVTAILDRIPAPESMDAETCYLGVEIDLSGALDKARIEEAFEFVREGSSLRILPPHSMVADYIALINSLPEDPARLGELLVASGALTEHELQEGLRLQAEAAEPPGAPRIGEILVEQGSVNPAVVDAALQRQTAIKEQRAREDNVVRVRADKLDDLITLVGELVIAGAGNRLLAQRAANPEILESAFTIEGLVEEVRDKALRLRMVPIVELFNRFKRVARDLGKELGKDVELLLSGVDTELDKSMVDRISDPLMHLVRNALDHGIESPDERVRAGKPAAGRLQLNAYHESGTVVIEVADDGAGLDRPKILARAVERGLVAPQAALAEPDIDRLIFEPGFSTAQTVTSVSGRGVGMDVVKRNVDALRGTVSLHSDPGMGTTVTVRLPLTLAIIDGFVVGVGKAAYVIPLEMMEECLELPAAEREMSRRRGHIGLRGEVLPLLHLREIFAIASDAGQRENIVVVRHAGARAGLVVDSLMGEFQTVIKPLGRIFEHLAGISGSTILGSGEVALILDVQELVARAVRRETSLIERNAHVAR